MLKLSRRKSITFAAIVRIPFHIPYVAPGTAEKVGPLLDPGNRLAANGPLTRQAETRLEAITGAGRAMLITSCTHGLEMAVMLAAIQPGDEVIMPAFTFVSVANAVALRGAVPVFVDLCADTQNVDPDCIDAAVTPKTKAIVVMHYAGVGCDMNAIMAIARRHNLLVIEDAAHGIGASYHSAHLGAIGHIGVISFHETKNIQCGEGGVLLLSDPALIEKAEMIREKGTNRQQFLNGEVDRYTWCALGSSYGLSELSAAYLLAQLDDIELVTNTRTSICRHYLNRLKPLAESGIIQLPVTPPHCAGNGHIFYVLLNALSERTALMQWLRQRGIQTTFHYQPLHLAPAGRLYGRFSGDDTRTLATSERLLRLPLFADMTIRQADEVADAILQYFDQHPHP